MSALVKHDPLPFLLMQTSECWNRRKGPSNAFLLSPLRNLIKHSDTNNEESKSVTIRRRNTRMLCDN